MKPMPLTFAVFLVFSPAVAPGQDAKKLPGDLLCDDDLLICRESCSMELGTQATNRERVGKCLYRCEQGHTVCLQRQIAKRQAAPRATEAPGKKRPQEKEEYFSGAPTRFSQQDAPRAAAPEEVEEVAPVRRSVTRTNELEAAPDNSAVSYPDREGFVSKGGPTRADREEVSRREAAGSDGEAPEEAEAPVIEQQKPAPKKQPSTPNELGY